MQRGHACGERRCEIVSAGGPAHQVPFERVPAPGYEGRADVAVRTIFHHDKTVWQSHPFDDRDGMSMLACVRWRGET